MLSIIISSYQPKFYNQLIDNIALTIGKEFKYEIIKIWNPNLMSITEAYNSGISKAKHQNLLFLHEDVIFHTENWGQKLITNLNYPKTGVVGVAGSDYIPIAPCSWTIVSKTNRNFYHFYQGSKISSDKKLNSNIFCKKEVFALDGVFLAVKKDIAEKTLFDASISSFHGYDLDFSLRVATQYKNYVLPDILLEHFSSGNVNIEWFKTNMKIRRKLGSNLQKKKNSLIERETYQDFLQNYFKYFQVTLPNLISAFRYYPLFAISINSNFKILNYLRYLLIKNKNP